MFYFVESSSSIYRVYFYKSTFYLVSCMHVASKLYGVDATIIIFVFVLYCIVLQNICGHSIEKKVPKEK